ncbi:hypothetical protein ACWDE0_07070 [Streptomyces sp. 900105755]
MGLALRQDGEVHEIQGTDGERISYQVAELTGVRDLMGWPEGMRLTVRRVKPSRQDARKLTAFEQLGRETLLRLLSVLWGACEL